MPPAPSRRVTLCVRQTRQSVSTSPLAADVWPVSDVKDSRTRAQLIWRDSLAGPYFPLEKRLLIWRRLKGLCTVLHVGLEDLEVRFLCVVVKI